MLVEKNKQLIEQNADLEAACQTQVWTSFADDDSFGKSLLLLILMMLCFQLNKKDADLKAADQKQKILAKQLDELQAVR